MELNRDRLTRFQQLLQDDAAKPDGVQFDLTAWAKPSYASVGYIDKRHAYTKDTDTVPVSCGTKACALGLAAISGIFKDEGLGWKIHIQEGDTTGMLTPTFGDAIDFDAGKQFFGLNSSESFFLFDPVEYRETQGAGAELEVVKRIQWLLDGNSYNQYSDRRNDDD